MGKFLFIVASTITLVFGSAGLPAADLMGAAENTPEARTFVNAANTTGLSDSLKSDGPYTVFAPADSAFEKLPGDTRKALFADKSKLAHVLAYHVIPGKTMVAEVKPGEVKTLEGGTLSVKSDNGMVTVNGARVIQSDLAADNGVIHIIDSVLQPQQ